MDSNSDFRASEASRLTQFIRQTSLFSSSVRYRHQFCKRCHCTHFMILYAKALRTTYKFSQCSYMYIRTDLAYKGRVKERGEIQEGEDHLEHRGRPIGRRHQHHFRLGLHHQPRVQGLLARPRTHRPASSQEHDFHEQ